ncbi:MAG: hypothetical protein IH598_13890 [Bacteroidales bacterium]|nr:hypothetical protein [Bacteroidales bacterium]
METETIDDNQPDKTNNQGINFEKYKLKIELLKWFIGSVALVVMTTVIDYGFRDRAAGMQEMQQYDKYVTELIVLNKEPGQKRMLAQFFAYVTPSEKLKKGWYDYYNEVDKEYQKYIAPVLVNDSITRAKYNQIILDGDNDNLHHQEQLSMLKQQMENNQRLINPEIILPGKSITSKDFETALEWQTKGFSFLLSRDIDDAIHAFSNSENAYNGFNMVYEIHRYLRANREKLIDKESAEWETAYSKIANDFSWKMPPEIKSKLLELSK